MYTVNYRMNNETIKIADDVVSLAAAIKILAEWQSLLTWKDCTAVDNYSAEPPAGWFRTLCVLGRNELPILTIWIEPTA